TVSGSCLARRTGHELLQRGALVWRKAQAEFRAAPEYVVGSLRRLLGHQITHLGGSQVGAQPDAEVLRLLCILQDPIDARAVGADQPLGVVIAQKRPSAPCALDQCPDPIVGEITARQAAAGSPGLC